MKEKIERFLKRNLKGKLTITTATLIAFLLSANFAVAEQNYQVGNNEIKREKNPGTLEDATEYLKKAGLFKIEAGSIENRLKDNSNFGLLAEVNKTFINKGRINQLINNGTGKIENRGYIYNIELKKASDIENLSNIANITSYDNTLLINNIFNKVKISFINIKSNLIENEGYIETLKKIKNLKNCGKINNIDHEAIAGTNQMKNYGISHFANIADYNALNIAGKLDNKGIVLTNWTSLQDIAANSPTLKDDKGRLIKNYQTTAIPDTVIDNGILNAYRGTIDKNLELKNNSIFNIESGGLEANKK